MPTHYVCQSIQDIRRYPYKSRDSRMRVRTVGQRFTMCIHAASQETVSPLVHIGATTELLKRREETITQRDERNDMWCEL